MERYTQRPMWKEEGRGLIIVEGCIEEEENSQGFYDSTSEENLIRRVAAAETIITEDTVTSGEFKKQKAQELNRTGVKKLWTIHQGMSQKVDKNRTSQ